MLKEQAMKKWCWWWCFLTVTLWKTSSAMRKHIGFHQNRICKNTVHGRHLISDDNGYVCNSLSLDLASRCCPQSGLQFSCRGCDHSSQCCNSYEYCVSCCSNPSKTSSQEIMNLKIAKPATAATYSSVFEFCSGRCRHNSDSVVHENAYLSEFHHCFSVSSKSRETNSTQPVARFDGINVIVGRQGESCDSACKLNGLSCVPNKLPVLNKCEIMQKYMRCKGACLESIGADQPAEVVDDAPKHLNPGACLYTRTQSMLSCDGYHQHTRRLCPCA